MVIIGGSESGKTYVLLNLIKSNMMMIIVLLTKFVLMLKIQISKYQYLIKKRKENNLKNLKISSSFIESSNNKQVVYKNLGEYNSRAKCNVLIVFNDMIADND